MQTSIMTNSPAEALQAQVSGSVIIPGDSRYTMTRRAWDLSIDQYPAVILIADNADDVAAGVRFANTYNMGVAIQSTGHGIVRPANDNMLIITSRLTSVEINAEQQTARVGAGVLWKHVLHAAAEFGLAPLLGSSSEVGVIGYTLGGGMGWLARKYGLNADSVKSIDIVTPDGVLRHASATENSELFWGLRGGGGNFGVVTGIEFKLYPVKTIYGGSLMYPVALAKDVLHFFNEWTRDMPNEMTTSISLLRMPPLPQIPEFLHNQVVVLVNAGYVGNAADGEALMQAWLDWQAPMQNTLHEMPFTEVDTISNDPVDPIAAMVTSEQFDELSDGAIETLVNYMTAENSKLVFVVARLGGGAIAEADRSANAIGNRDSRFYVEMLAPTPTPEMRAEASAYFREFKHALAPYINGGMYLNFMNGTDVHMRTRDAYSVDNFRRLQALKAAYDPKNLFRFSFSIPALEM